MKKHTTDELFAAKLKDHSVVPSQRAADLFQKRLAEKQQPKGIFMITPVRNYYWAAAASILFAFGIGWYSLRDNPMNTVVAQQTEIKNDDKLVEEPSDTSESVQQSPQKKETLAIVPQQSEELKTSPKAVKRSSLNVEGLQQKVAQNKKRTEPFTIPTVTPIILDEPIMDQLTVAVLDAQKEKSKEATKNRRAQKETGGVFKNSIAETIVVITEIKPTEEKLMIPEINGDSPITVARATEIGRQRMDSERSFIAKVFTEIKHLKHGEKMDVAGLNQKSNEAFARADEGFIANEKQELSYRFNRIKGLFSKDESR